MGVNGKNLFIKTDLGGAINTVTTGSNNFIASGWNLVAYQLLTTGFVLSGWPNFGGMVSVTLSYNSWDPQTSTVFCSSLAAGPSAINIWRGNIHTIWVDSSTMSTGAISGIALNMASCTTTCGFYAGSWYDMTHTSSNTFTNYYPPGGATFTKPGIVAVNGGGAVMAVW